MAATAGQHGRDDRHSRAAHAAESARRAQTLRTLPTLPRLSKMAPHARRQRGDVAAGATAEGTRTSASRSASAAPESPSAARTSTPASTAAPAPTPLPAPAPTATAAPTSPALVVAVAVVTLLTAWLAGQVPLGVQLSRLLPSRAPAPGNADAASFARLAGGREPLAWTAWFANRTDLPHVDWRSAAAPVGASDTAANPMEAIVAEGVPVRITNSPAAAWPALSRWTPAYLQERLAAKRDLPEVIVSPTPQIVYYDVSKPMREVQCLPVRLPQHERRSVPTPVFFATIANASDPTFMYWVGQKQRGNLYKFMQEALHPTAPFWAPWGGRTTGEPNMQTWVGKSGITSVVHYDASHNVYVQLYGEKTFVILPPSHAALFQICPFMHPGDGHSCLDWIALEAAGAGGGSAPANWGDVGAHVVRLAAGDVLYIPPYWLHHVVTTGTGEAMSVSLITQSQPQVLMQQVERFPLRFEHAWQRRMRITGVILLVQHLLDGVHRRADAGAGALLRARYASWLSSPEPELAAKLLGRDVRCTAPKEEPVTEAAREGARAIAALFAQVADRGVQQLLLFNYIEAMAYWAVRDPALVAPLLHLMAQRCP